METARSEAFDVVILGGGLAGLLLSRQLRRELPQLSVAVLEKTTRPIPDASHKVGESSVELGSQYLERLGLRDYLHERHLIKFGLRFFPGGGHLPIDQRTELGPAQEPIVTSYQTDRGRLEEDLREMVVEQDGVSLFEGATVRDVALTDGSEPHTVEAQTADGGLTLTGRWVVDATGRAGFLKRRLKLKRGTRHSASAGWFRVEGRVDVNDMASADAAEWHGQPFAGERWRSTNHFMGPGYWVWVIPLPTGNTSIGAVIHGDTHDFDDVRSLERVKAFIATHEPHLAALLERYPVLDFLCLKEYSYSIARAWSDQRWGTVGEAGAFVDPLYSPGTDFIAFANSFQGEIIRTDVEGGDLTKKVRELNLQYRALVAGSADVFRVSSPVYGHARAMGAKIFWDNLAYWSFPCQYYLQGIYRLTGEAHAAFGPPGQRFVQLSGYVQDLLRGWALAAPADPDAGFVGMPAFPSLLVDAHVDLHKEMTPAEALEYLQMRGAQGEEVVLELTLRIVQELGPELGRELLERIEFGRWGLFATPQRLAAEDTVGLARRRALSPIARDVERSLGRPRRHERAAEARALLLAPDAL